MTNTGYIFVDDGYPESADYESNYIGYDQAEPGGYETAVAEARARLRVQVNVPEPQPCGAGALRIAQAEKSDAPGFLKRLSFLLDNWGRLGSEWARRREARNTTSRHFVPKERAGFLHGGDKRTFCW